eukprot:Phypoly_transcript_09658.p1 GENE.Phypoly_transcript_09658~~Phypoly_transcript_09658.p1  ORF type:complete len:414 (+),score=52.29 Phypoly_transcript_09658:114-1355(+)
MIRDAILVGLFSWVGVLMRISLAEVYSHTFIHGNIAGPISKNFYPNVVGCAILGVLVSLQTKIKARYPPLYVGLASGLCGSLTTFSGISEDASQQLMSHNVTSFFATLFVGFGCPYWILSLGVNLTAYMFKVPLPSSAPIMMATHRRETESNTIANISPVEADSHAATGQAEKEGGNSSSTTSPANRVTVLTPSSTSSAERAQYAINEDDATGVATAPEADLKHDSDTRSSTSSGDRDESGRNEDDVTGVATAPESALDPPHPAHVHKRFYGASLLFGIGIFTMLSLLAALRSPPSYILFSCLFAPFGALLRWYLAIYNLKFPKFPVFTFLVNFVGSMLLAGFTILASRSHNLAGSAALNGAVTGFCGALTTTSTFLNEARILDTKYSFIYVIVSVFGTQIILLVINGPYYWR